MKKILFDIFNIISLLFRPIAGAADPDLPVLAGLDAIVKFEGRTVAWATNVSFDEDFELQGIDELQKR